jgi:hypothetical protein
MVFLRAADTQALPIHPSLKDPNPKEVELDQPFCRYDPHVLGIREGQKLVAKNSAPVAHNVMITGFQQQHNPQLPPGRSHTFELLSERNAIRVSCGQHPWMQGFLWVFDHPYFAVTDANGAFKIEKAPAGKWNLVIWHEEIGYVDGRNGRPIEIKAGAPTDVGQIGIKADKK